mmetsp:Transcript_16161/g.44774  ORF Transcript_16161/g.44774 Transcript_16161/m.44774 type:complete len:135 (-) Transcript_16161:270-674(-)
MSLNPCTILLPYCASTLQSSIIVTGVPTKAYRLPTEWIKQNATVINVSSFKNVDEESLLKVPGIVYVPMVGKVTVAMLERNLVRLYDNFHSPAAKQTPKALAPSDSAVSKTPTWLQAYTAIAVTALLAVQILRK